MNRNGTRFGVKGGMLLVALVVGAWGCSHERPLHVIRSNAEHSARYGQYDVAATDYELFLNRKPDDHTARYEYGKVLMSLNRPGDAASQFATAVDVDRFNEDYMEAYAQSLYEANQREKLVEVLRRRVAERGQVSDYGRLGRFSAKLGHADEAEEALTTAARLDGGQSLGPQLDLARFYGSINDRVKQRRRLQACYYLAPKRQEVLDAIREAGDIAGPTYAAVPQEYAGGLPITNVPEPVPAGGR